MPPSATLGIPPAATAVDRLPDPYQTLGRRGGLDQAAMVGAVVAAAQLGVPFAPLDRSARVAVEIAGRLNPQILAWLVRPSLPLPRSLDTVAMPPAPGRPRPERRTTVPVEPAARP